MAATPIKTGRVTLEWVNIRGEGKENLSGKMQYVANGVVEDTDPLLAEIQAFWDKNKPAGFKKDAKSLGIYDHTVKSADTDENGKPIYVPDGKKYLAFKTGVAYSDGKPKVVRVYNAKGKLVEVGDLKIGNGSVGVISGAMDIYTNKTKAGQIVDAGVTLYLDAIQIIKLNEYTQDPGFEAVDDEDAWGGDEWTGEEESAAPEAAATPRL